MNVKNEWVTEYARSLYFPKDHSFAIPKEHFLPIQCLSTSSYVYVYWEIIGV
jgi:hypothetical protein